MGCCGGNNSASAGVPGDLIDDDIDNGIFREDGECNQSAISRGNQGGGLDGSGNDEPNKIQNVQIVVGCDGKKLVINDVLKLTSTSTRKATTWTMTPGIPGVTLDAASGKIYGTLTDSIPTSKTYDVTVTASDATGQIDSRPFKVVAEKCDPGKGITFTCPIPGNATCTSRVKIRTLNGQTRPHKGLDLVGNSSVVATADGTVVYIQPNCSDAGPFVVMEHKNGAGKLICYSRYLHLANINVSVGQKVAKGARIGTMR
jgi:murein DD-endopeptidase MepM/ murein hydrolase activator NlpD